jgi:photosystem II stability/assembly factor-like uncharacterized protein
VLPTAALVTAAGAPPSAGRLPGAGSPPGAGAPTSVARPRVPGTFAEHALLAARSLLLDVAFAGERWVAVGERGHVLLSDDHGQTWRQAESVPTRALLTGVCFGNAREGVAVGHDEVILVTHDAGLTWTLAHFAPESQQPLLDVTCSADGRVIAVGAYGAYFSSHDGGTNWSERKFTALAGKAAVGHGPAADAVGPEPAAKAATREPPNDDVGRDFHLNKIAAASTTTLYIAAEGGHLYRTGDGGETWRELPSPYDGSFFGVKPLGDDIVLAYGLRGNLFRSEDAGATWRKVETGTHAMLNDAASVGRGGTIAVVGLSGVVLVSRDGGRSFGLMHQEDRKGLSAAMGVGSDTLVVVGEGGAGRLNIAPSAVKPSGATGP